MMKNNDGIPSYHGNKNDGTCFFGWFFNEEYSEKKLARLLSIHFEVFWKTGASKAYKSSHQKVFSKKSNKP